jgi:hypothetical protein
MPTAESDTVYCRHGGNRQVLEGIEDLEVYFQDFVRYLVFARAE